MEITLVAALDRGRVIGRNGDLPWRLATDLAFFKETTFGGTVVVGRRTFESTNGPLPGRDHLVLSDSHAIGPDAHYPRVVWVRRLDDAIDEAKKRGLEELFVLGGERVFREAIPHATRLVLTFVDANVSGDTFFPEFDENLFEVEEILRFEASERDEFSGVMRVFRRKPGYGASHLR